MKPYTVFLALQIARFGALSVPQMLELCTGRCQKSTLYYTLKKLAKQGFVKRISHPLKTLSGYAATPELYELVYGESHSRITGTPAQQLEHSIARADALVRLSRYSKVSGIATEYEIDHEDMRKFCFGRVPDGIVQLHSENGSLELAVEVETNLKSSARIQEILQSYAYTLSRDMLCGGLIVVAGTENILSGYQEGLSNIPPEIARRVLIISIKELDRLNEKHFGQLTNTSFSVLESIRSVSKNRIEYVPMKSAAYTPKNTNKGPHTEGLSGFGG